MCWGLSVSVSVSSAQQQSVFTCAMWTLSGRTQATGASLSRLHITRVSVSQVAGSCPDRRGAARTDRRGGGWPSLPQHLALRPLRLRLSVLFSCDRRGDTQTWLELHLNPAPESRALARSHCYFRAGPQAPRESSTGVRRDQGL